uniref:AlNc14C10G1303 protein n=1 Tax=Albugo laibachii Nc14 TaxID=890382 RepID=F0W2R5_9STRA|nr:AlNc14C10G1303 [Albugo laibachii Nc14]|eukprot:CCA15351.1 AlNc14C10G1303 [Albugo laibachii Nc14]
MRWLLDVVDQTIDVEIVRQSRSKSRIHFAIFWDVLHDELGHCEERVEPFIWMVNGAERIIGQWTLLRKEKCQVVRSKERGEGAIHRRQLTLSMYEDMASLLTVWR